MGDLVISTLLGAWAAQKIIGGLPALAGTALPIAGRANDVAIATICLIVLRFSFETICAIYYPARLATVAPAKVPFSSLRQRYTSLGMRTGLYLFVVIAYMPYCWELYAGVVLYVLPQVLKMYENKFPNHAGLYRIIPGGITKTVLFMFIGRWYFEIFQHHVAPTHLLTYGFVFLGLPSLILSVLELFGREGPDREKTWWHQLAGASLLVVGVLFVFGMI